MVGHSLVFQILLQIEVRMSIMASPPAWTNSAGMLSTPADFPSSALRLLLPPLVEKDDALHLVSVGSQVLLGPRQSHSCKGLSSTLSTC